MHHLSGHPHVVTFKGAYEDASHVHIVMELCTGGELFEHIAAKGHYREHDAAHLMRSVLMVVEHAHNMNVVHRDLKVGRVVSRALGPHVLCAAIKGQDSGLDGLACDPRPAPARSWSHHALPRPPPFSHVRHAARKLPLQGVWPAAHQGHRFRAVGVLPGAAAELNGQADPPKCSTTVSCLPTPMLTWHPRFAVLTQEGLVLRDLVGSPFYMAPEVLRRRCAAAGGERKLRASM
jgi:serine/threonine protein kinase